MTVRSRMLARIVQQEDLNFLLTNRIPRRLLTRFMGWFSQIEQPLVRDLSIAIWRLFLRPRPVGGEEDRIQQPARLLHPRAQGRRAPGRSRRRHSRQPLRRHRRRLRRRSPAPTLFQIKGLPYTLQDLLGDPRSGRAHRDGRYVTLRLTSSMYHRFHAPHDCRVEQVTYISGDTWNVNPIALKRVEKLFCKNERAVLETHADATAASAHAGAGRRHPGRQHPPALPRCPADA